MRDFGLRPGPGESAVNPMKLGGRLFCTMHPLVVCTMHPQQAQGGGLSAMDEAVWDELIAPGPVLVHLVRRYGCGTCALHLCVTL